VADVTSIITTAWDHVQTAYTALVRAENLAVPHYIVGVQTALSSTRYPVLVRAKDYIRQDTSGITGEELKVALDFVLIHVANKPETLEANSLKYMNCLLEMIRDDDTFGGACQLGEFVASEFFDGSGNDRSMEIVKISVLLRQEVEI